MLFLKLLNINEILFLLFKRISYVYTFCLVTLLGSNVLSQPLHTAQRFTIKDGLPSNQIYTVLQDRLGFLWFATDNGVSRYDGKSFRNFSMNDGLPDENIFDILQDKDGTIWVSSYTRVAYFDAAINKFIIPENEDLLNTGNSASLLGIKLMNDGILASNAGGYSFMFRNKKLVSRLKKNEIWKLTKAGANHYLYSCTVFDTRGRESCYVVYDKDGVRDSVLLVNGFTLKNGDGILIKINNDTLYVTRKTGKQYIVNVTNNKIHIDSIIIKNKVSYTTVTGNKITIAAIDGGIYIFDKTTLRLSSHIQLNEYCTYAYTDNWGNTWAATLGRGVIWLRPDYVDYFSTFSNKLDQRFRAISVDTDNNVYLGNYFGDVIRVRRSQKSYYLSLTGKYYSWIRGIIMSSGKSFVFNDGGGYVDYSRPLLLNGKKKLARIKTCMPLNDSTIILGTVNTTADGGLYELNTKTEVVSSLRTPVEWISSLAHLNKRYIYLGAANGLYKYDYSRKKYLDVFKETPLHNKRVLFIASAKNDLLVTAIAGAGIYFIKNDQVLAFIPNNVISDKSLVCIVADPRSCLWIGTKSGIVKISYSFINDIINYNVVNYASLGSLLAADINALYLKGTKLYLATGIGAGVFDTRISPPSDSITPILTEVKINQKVRPVSDSFKLAADENSVALAFSGVNINGNLKVLQYSLDTAKGWLDLSKNILNLELNSGVHNIKVRAISESGYVSGNILKLYFYVKLPLYLQWWFIIMLTASIVTAFYITYINVKNVRLRKKEQSKLKIEQERNRITADLHDEIGASLSSLQMYSDVALEVLDRDKEKSRIMLNKISTKAYKISGTIGDIIWSIRPVEESSITIESRVRNMVHELIGDSNILYETIINKNIDKAPRNFLFRKNCILIIKEALNNSLKYSKAGNIYIEIDVDVSHCILCVKDDGEGFDVDQNIGKGNGLHIMKLRVTELGGHIQIFSAKALGTTIFVTFPLANTI